MTQGDNEFVTNGEFESDMTGWTVSTSGTGEGSAAGGVAGGHSGNCCQISITNDAGEHTTVALLATQHVGDYIGQYYTVTFWVKCTDVALQGNSSFLANVVGGEQYIEEDIPSDWTQFSITGRTTSLNPNSYFSIYFSTAVEGAFTGIYLDSISIQGGMKVIQADVPVTPGWWYDGYVYAKSGTCGDGQSVEIDFDVKNYASTLSNPTTGSWVASTFVLSAMESSTVVELSISVWPVLVGTTLIDTVQMHEGLTPFTPAFPFLTDTMTTVSERVGVKSLSTAISNLQTGSFDVTYEPDWENKVHINSLGILNFYMVLGVHPTESFPDTPETGTDPTWVQDGEDMLGGDETTEANRVEYHIATAIAVGHTDDGKHPYPTPYGSGRILIETGTLAGSGVEQTITLTNRWIVGDPEAPDAIKSIDIQEIWLVREGINNEVVYATVDVPTGKSKRESNPGYYSTSFSPIVSFGVGEFVINSSKLEGTGTIHWLVLGVAGEVT